MCRWDLRIGRKQFRYFSIMIHLVLPVSKRGSLTILTYIFNIEETIHLTTLDEYCAQNEIESVDLLKK